MRSAMIDRRRLMVTGAAIATLRLGGTAHAEGKDVNVGVVASVTGPFEAPTKDTFDGFNAWLKLHGVPGRKLVTHVVDDETNPVNAANLFRRVADDASVSLVYFFINSPPAMAANPFPSDFKVRVIGGGGAHS